MIIGILSGSGIKPETFFDGPTEKKKVHTPYGAPSDLVTIGKIAGKEILMLPRHGPVHNIQPGQVNYRANIWALKELGATHILAPTAVGSLREEIKPGHLVFPDQFIDRTTKREQSLYTGQVICHISMADPFCLQLRQQLTTTAQTLGLAHHPKGTVITIEGPRFSTRAESHMFRQWNADIINMTTVPEVVLAREAGMCYVSIAMSTDYDSWKENQEAVTLEMVLATMKTNAENVKKLVHAVIPIISQSQKDCECKNAVSNALI